LSFPEFLPTEVPSGTEKVEARREDESEGEGEVMERPYYIE